MNSSLPMKKCRTMKNIKINYDRAYKELEERLRKSKPSQEQKGKLEEVSKALQELKRNRDKDS